MLEHDDTHMLSLIPTIVLMAALSQLWQPLLNAQVLVTCTLTVQLAQYMPLATVMVAFSSPLLAVLSPPWRPMPSAPALLL
jgi:hypothetical protein